MIGSSEAMIAIVSAIRLPGMSRPTVWRWMKLVRRVLAPRAFDRGVRPARPGPDQARQLGHDRAVGHLVEALVDDPEALLDLVHAQQVAGQAIAFRPGGDVEVELWVDAVRMGPANVEGHPGGPQVGPRHAHPQGGLGVDHAQPAGPPHEDLVLVEEGLVRVDLVGGLAHPGPQPAHELVVQVAVDAADPEVVEEHPLAGQGRQHLDDLVALDEAPQDRRQAAQVEREPAHEQGMAGDPVELAREDPDVLRAARNLDFVELLEGDHRRPLAEQRADVLERVHVADRLVVVGVLAQLLDTAVEIAQDRVEIDDLLAVDLEDDPQDAVGRWMLGAHVHEHLAVAQGVELGLALGSGRVRRDGLEHSDLLVQGDPRVVRRGVGRDVERAPGSGHRQPAVAWRMRASSWALVGPWVCSIGRTPPAGERDASSARKKSLRSGKLA
jgi:hypothetical protein